MLVIESIRHLFPLLNQYLNEKIASLKGGILPGGRTALAVLLEHFVAQDKRGLAPAESVILPPLYFEDMESYQQLINVYDNSGQLSWGKLMELSALEMGSVLKDQLSAKIELSFLKAMLIFRLRHQLAKFADQAEAALIARETLENDIAARLQLAEIISSRLTAIQHSDMSQSYGWNAVSLYFSQLENAFGQFQMFDVEQSLKDPSFINSVWTEQNLHQQVMYNILSKKLEPRIELFKTREAARALWEAEKHADAEKEKLLLAAQVEALKIARIDDKEVEDGEVKPNIQLLQEERAAQKAKLAQQEAAFKEINQLVQATVAELKVSITKQEYDAEAEQILSQMNDFIAHHSAPLQEALQAEEQLIDSIQTLFKETSSLLQSALEAADATFQPMARVSFSVGAGAGESEAHIEALRLTFGEACKFISNQNRFNMRPALYHQARAGNGHPTLILLVQALNYIMSSADQQGEYTLPGSQSSWGSSIASAVFHPIVAASRLVSRFFYDPKLAEQKREAVTQLVSDFSTLVSYKPNKPLKEKHWQEALNQLDNGYSGLSGLGYSLTLSQQKSLTFVKEAHRRILEAAPNTVRTNHEHRCRLGH